MLRKERVALVTGGARGLGRHICEAYLREGYCIAVNYLHADRQAAELLAEAEDRAIAVKADVSDLAQVQAMVSIIDKAFGRLDVLINNAGITKDSLLLRQTEDDWDAIVRTNLTGPFNAIKTSVPLMLRSGGGSIINVSSYSGIKGRTGQAAYSASKAGLIGLTVTAARELAADNISVNAVIPGYMRTEMGSQAPGAMDEAIKESLLKTLTNPVDVARGIVCLSESAYITGQTISLDSRII